MRDGNRPKIVLLGGGLANGLIALKLFKKGFKDFLLVERETRLGGEHTWSFHTSDVDSETYEELKPMLLASWPQQQVRFSSYDRFLKTGYNSITSNTFHDYLFDVLPSGNVALNSEAVIKEQKVKIDSKELYPEVIIDGRGAPASAFKPCGYQKFYGLDVTLDSPHGLEHPIIMDASVVQKEGFRFIYSLPFSERRILVEDTRYSLNAKIDENEIRHEVEAYTNNRYGRIKEINRVEKFALPIPLEPRTQTFNGNSVQSGLRGGLFQPVTGYSLPIASRFAKVVAENANMSGSSLLFELKEFIRNWEKHSKFYYILNQMMFGAAVDEKRVEIFKRFYRLNHGLIERFYRGELKASDRVRLLMGKPPVPIGDAFKSITDHSWLDELR